jgi:SAM-dependent methyltransferase
MQSRDLSALTMASKLMESPASERNKDPIWDVLESKVFVPPLVSNSEPKALQILEIASGAGVHTLHFCSKLLHQGVSFEWYPADMDESYRASTQACVDSYPQLDSSMVATPTPLTLDENGIVEKDTALQFADLSFDVIFNCNMIHISPWEATLGLMKVAGGKLRPGGFLVLYGPYKVNGTYVESNRYVPA